MKLLKLHIESGDQSGGILDDFSINFHRPEKSNKNIDPICFVGVNGSGKSQVLQVIAEIFYYLDRHFCKFHPSKVDTNLVFEIEYLIQHNSQAKHVRIKRIAPKKNIKISILQNDQEVPVSDTDDIEELLPRKIIGYTSGGNETLSVPFLTLQRYLYKFSDLSQALSPM